jgi:hypothetical protein
MAHGPSKQPPFSGQLTRITREGEQGSVAFTAHTPEELRRKLAEASAALDARVQANNAALLDAASTFEERQQKVYAQAVAQLRRELGLPADSPGGNGAAPDHADHTAGPIHAPENP